MRDQHSLGAGAVDLDMGLDGVTAAAYIGRDIGRHVPHAGVKDEMVPRALEPRGVLRKARGEAVVQRQDIVLLRLAPPQSCQFSRRSGSLAARSSTSEKSRSR